MSTPSFWRDFPVQKTLVLDKLEQVKSVCDTMILDYLKLLSTNDFSYRILLPRKEDFSIETTKNKNKDERN